MEWFLVVAYIAYLIWMMGKYEREVVWHGPFNWRFYAYMLAITGPFFLAIWVGN